MIRGIFFLTVVAVLAGTFSTIEAAGSEEGKAGRINVLTHDSLARDGADSAAVTGDSVLDTSTAVLPLCTLEIVTEPEGAAVLLDGKEVGASPLIVADVDTGKHTLLIKKTGYYQKKVTILLTSDRKTTLRFSLSAPGSLSIVTEPPEAAVSINGERKGKSPYTDSLVKPGIYFLSLEKEHYQTIVDSITVPSNGRVSRSDTLLLVASYRDSLDQAAALARKKRKRIGISVVAGLFALFLLVMAIIELQE